MVVGREGVGTWAQFAGTLSRVYPPETKLMLGWKGRLKERLVVDMVLFCCRGCTFQLVTDEVENAVAGNNALSQH